MKRSLRNTIKPSELPHHIILCIVEYAFCKLREGEFKSLVGLPAHEVIDRITAQVRAGEADQ